MLEVYMLEESGYKPEECVYMKRSPGIWHNDFSGHYVLLVTTINLAQYIISFKPTNLAYMKDILKPGEVDGACFLVNWFLGEGSKVENLP